MQTQNTTRLISNFEQSRKLRTRVYQTIPGGCHTYAKGDDQFPELAPGFITRGSGCHVWDVDGNEFIEYGMGLRAVTLGHAFPPVIEAVRASLEIGTNFSRPSPIELDCAEDFLSIIEGADMVKFTKDGSSATTAAIKLARKYTGRELVAICAEHPFFSYDDWFMCSTTMDGGIPSKVRNDTLQFHYNDLDSVRALFERNRGNIAAIILEPARLDEPEAGFLANLRELCSKEGTVLIFDEMITGFRWNLGGAQKEYGVVPDLSCFGKALANGFALSAVCGKREIMRLGSRDRTEDDVFLLSTTHGAEVPGLVAAIATMKVYREEPVIAHLYRQGEKLASGVRSVAQRHGVDRFVKIFGRPCNQLYGTKGPDGQPSQYFRALFLQELIKRGVIAPSFIVSYSHTDEDVDRTVEAVGGALEIYARALEEGIEKYLVGGPTRHVFDRRS